MEEVLINNENFMAIRFNKIMIINLYRRPNSLIKKWIEYKI